MRWLDHWNQHAQPFRWTKSAVHIKRSLARLLLFTRHTTISELGDALHTFAEQIEAALESAEQMTRTGHTSHIQEALSNGKDAARHLKDRLRRER